MARIRTSTVTVNLSATATIPTTVFDYEIPVLEAIHGELDTELIRRVDQGAIELDIEDPAELYSALQQKYARKGGDVVRSVYPNRRAFEKALLESVDDDEDEKPAKAKRRGKAKPEDAPEGDEGSESPQG